MSNKRVRRHSPETKRKWNLSTRYGLTEAKLDAMRVAQNGLCAICRKPMKRECIDHCHQTKKVRGLLCHKCNIDLPAIEDAAFVVAAQHYLKLHAS